VLATNLYPLLTAASKRADQDHLTKLSIAIFSGDRKSTWQFPTVFRISMARRQVGKWSAPKLTEGQTEALFTNYVRKMKLRGAVLRHERT
jgi:hypothetical protein